MVIDMIRNGALRCVLFFLFLFPLVLVLQSPASAEEWFICNGCQDHDCDAAGDDEVRTFSTYENALNCSDTHSGDVFIVQKTSNDTPLSYFYLPTAEPNGYAGVLENWQDDDDNDAGAEPEDVVIKFQGNLGFVANDGTKKAVTLKKDPDETAQCIIRGSDVNKSTIYITDNDPIGVTIEGFTIVGDRGTGSGNGGAMSIHKSMNVNNCVLRDSSAELGGAVSVTERMAKPIFNHCIFYNNRADLGAAIYVHKYQDATALDPGTPSMPQFFNCLFTGNDAEGTGDVFYLDVAPATLVNCTIAGNDSSDTLIYQEDSFVGMTIVNCIIVANDTEHEALHTFSLPCAGNHGPTIVDTFILGIYNDDSVAEGATYLRGATSRVYDPSGVLLSHGPRTFKDAITPCMPWNLIDDPPRVYEYYDEYSGDKPLYLVNNHFNLTFAPNLDSDDDDNGQINFYRLASDSSCIGLGSSYLKDDFEGDFRPYYLSSRPDIGWDEFSFCAHQDWNTVDDDVANVNFHLPLEQKYTEIGKWFQEQNAILYEITPPESGILSIFSEGSDVDLLGILSTDCNVEEILITDGKNGTWKNFHIDYVYAQKGVPYYLSVVNQSDMEGDFLLSIDITSDGEPNSCEIADTEGTPVVFTKEYFNTENEDERNKYIGTDDIRMAIDSPDDEDVFRLDFPQEGSVGGTLVITCEFVKIFDDGNWVAVDVPAKYLDIELKEKVGDQYQTVAWPTGTGELMIIDHNPDDSSRYLVVKKDASLDENILPIYSFKARYFSPDEDLGNKNGRALTFDVNQDGDITYPGDKDYYYFVVENGGTIQASTSGCPKGVLSRIDVYNSAHEKIVDKGYYPDAGNLGDYIISSAWATEEQTDPVTGLPVIVDIETPFFVSPGIYYIRVAHTSVFPEGYTAEDIKKYDFTAPFEYNILVNFTASAEGDEYADFYQMADVVYPWTDEKSGMNDAPPELYYETKSGQINASGDKDYFRIEVPYKALLDVMVDSSASYAVSASLKDYRGTELETANDIRTNNPACLIDAPDVGRISRKVDKGVYYIGISSPGVPSYSLNIDIDDFPDTPTQSEEPAANWAFSKSIGHIETVSAGCANSHDTDVFRFRVQKENQFRIFTTGDNNTEGVLYKCNDVDCLSWVTLPQQDLEDYYLADYDFIKQEGEEDIIIGNFFLGSYHLENKEPFSDDYVTGQYGIPLTEGIYAMSVTMADNANATGSYALHINQLDDYCGKPSCAEEITMTHVNEPDPKPDWEYGTQNGTIEIPGDIDYFALNPGFSGRLILSSNLEKPNIILKLMDENNRRLIYSTSGHLEFDVTFGHTYYISANPQYALNTGLYSFDLRLFTYLEDGNGDLLPDYASDNDGLNGTSGNDFVQASTLTFSGDTASYATGGVDLAGDHDYYMFNVTGPCILNVYTTGDTDTYGYLFLEKDYMFNLVMSNDDSEYDRTDGRNFGMYYYLAETGVQTMYVKVQGYSPKETGDYKLYITYKNGEDDHGDECETATFVSLSADTNSNDNLIEFEGSNIGIPGDNDYFKIVAGPVWDLENGTLTEQGTVTVYTSDFGGYSLDMFGYLKNLGCGTIALNDDGTGGSDGQNFRIKYTPNCGAECIPRTYHVLAKSFNGKEIGLYNFHVESNGAFVESQSKTRIFVPQNSTEYVGFETPTHQSYLHASTETLAGSPLIKENLKVTIMEGDGTIVSKKDNNGEDEITFMKQLPFPIYIDGLKRGLHYLKIDNTDPDNSEVFNVLLSCSPIGFIGYNGAEGWFEFTENGLNVGGNGSGFGGAADSGYFVYRKIDSGFETIARLEFTNSVYGSAGLMVRNDIEEDADKNVFIYVHHTSDGYTVYGQYRDNKVNNNTYEIFNSKESNPLYLRLHYGGSGSEVRMSFSTDGKNWLNWFDPDNVEDGDPVFEDPSYSADVNMVTPLFVGYAVSSDSISKVEVTFTEIQFAQIPTGEN